MTASVAIARASSSGLNVRISGAMPGGSGA
jgi:hypothetical protein